MMKYIIFTDGDDEFPVIFPTKLVHKDMAEHVQHSARRQHNALYLEPVSAGFVNLSEVKCGGESESMSLKSRGTVDKKVIENSL